MARGSKRGGRPEWESNTTAKQGEVTNILICVGGIYKGIPGPASR